jgi:DNA-binding MarR family transcriptional regulator
MAALDNKIDPTSQAIAAALLETSRVFTQVRAHDTLCRQADVDLDRSGAMLLYKLHAEGENVRLTDLAERLEIDAPGVTRKVQQLERAGLVQRSSDPMDGRALRLSLTEAGRRSIERLLAERERWLESLLVGWTGDDRRDFARLLRLFATSMARSGERDHGT